MGTRGSAERKRGLSQFHGRARRAKPPLRGSSSPNAARRALRNPPNSSVKAAWARFTRRGDTELERLVALKLIRPELASHPENLASLQQELIPRARGHHRNVIRIFDLGQAQGIKFITMEYVEGRDLKGLNPRKNETHC